MLWTKLMLSPMPHARITRLDLSAALAMPGVKAILTADDLPEAQAGGTLGENVQASTQGERILTKEPVYEGEPILAVAAVDEATAAEAIEKIIVEFEALPFVVDPLVSLRPNGPNARVGGNYWGRPPAPPAPAGGRGAPPPPLDFMELKWTEQDFADYDQGKLPMGKTPPDEWAYGDIEAGFKNAALVLDETFVTPNTHHQTLETRSAMAYWQNGKLFLHAGTQSAVQTVASISRWLSLDPSNIVLITEYTGGGF